MYYCRPKRIKFMLIKPFTLKTTRTAENQSSSNKRYQRETLIFNFSPDSPTELFHKFLIKTGKSNCVRPPSCEIFK